MSFETYAMHVCKYYIQQHGITAYSFYNTYKNEQMITEQKL